MKKRIKFILLIIIVLAIVGIVAAGKIARSRKPQSLIREITPARGDIVVSVSTTGVVEPQNRLEIKPTMSGRVEQILVKEGDRVRAGQTLALLSSTERATLLDAARLQSPEKLAYWEEAYKPSPLLAPIDGEVIVRGIEPGQTVTSSTAVLVLSDRLIVKAQVDETDIGRVEVGQSAVISLDAYPEIKIKSRVDHIAYESKTVSNVTIYEVDILPDQVPPVFRSGMSANVEIIEQNRKDVLTLPEQAVRRKRGQTFVLMSAGKGKEPRWQQIELGVSNGEKVEVASGLDEEDRVLIDASVYKPAAESSGGGPLTPWSRRRRR